MSQSQMKISANKRMYQSYNSQSSLDTANESPVIVFDSQNPKRINNLATPSGCSSRLVLKKNRPLNNSNVVQGGNNLNQQHNPERIPVKSSHIRFQSSQHSDLSINNFFETPNHPQKNKPSKLKHAASSAAPSECFLDTSVDEQQQFSENIGDVSNAPGLKKSSSVQQKQQLDSSIMSDDNDEFNVWDNSSAKQIGIDVAGEQVKVPLEFIELFYVRSQLYQKDKVAKPDVLEEVQVISKMCNKPMSMIRSSNLVDNIEKNYLLSMKKNAKDVSQLSFDSKTGQNFHHSENNISKSQIPHTNSQQSLTKHTPKAFRISQYNPFQSPNNNNNNPMSSTQSHSKMAPFKAVSQQQIEIPSSIFQHPPVLNKNNNASRNLFRFASNDAISMASTHHINLAASSVKSRDSPASRNNFPKNSNEQALQQQQSAASLQQSPFIRVKKVSIRLSDKNNNIHTPSKYAASKVAIDKIMRVTSQTAIQSTKKLFPQSHFTQDGLRA